MFIAYDRVNDQAFGPFGSEEKAKAFSTKLDATLGSDQGGRGLAGGDWSHIEVMFVDEDDFDYTAWLGEPDFRRTFGPGRLESIELVAFPGDDRRLVQGTYKIYCGNGNEHTFVVDSGMLPVDVWENYRSQMPYRKVKPTDADLDEYAVGLVVEEVLNEEWSDPCEESIEADHDDEDYIAEQQAAIELNRLRDETN